MNRLITLLPLFLALSVTAAPPSLKRVDSFIEIAGRLESVRLPEGFELELLTSRLNVPRLFTFAPNGDLLIGSGSGKVYRVPPPYTQPEVLVALDGYPHDVAIRGDELLVARTNGVYRAPYRAGQRRIDEDAFCLENGG